MVTTDRLSCFDVCITTIPFKGQILNQIAASGFKTTQAIVENHIIDIPDPNVFVVRECEVLPIELVVRGYLAGGGWRSYQQDGSVSGISLPPGLREFQKLEQPLVTPSTKAAKGQHDEPISSEEIVHLGILTKARWEELSELVLALFKQGTEDARSKGLLLADTKYEIGLWNGKFVLVDEVHTLDSSRFWKAESYSELLANGQSPEMLDKEPARRWLMAQGYDGRGALPKIHDAWREEVALHYWNSADQLLGAPCPVDFSDPLTRLNAYMEFVGKSKR